ncbi:MAG: Formyltransferase/hydrolase complex Fhc subunit [Planctomycetota bacterium]|jgi:formylmethanofuran dehydrogenase subunit C
MPLVLAPSTDAAAGGPLAIDLTGILPARLAPLSPDEIRRLSILADERPCELGEVFRATGSAADGRLECRGDFSRVHSLAVGMAAGRILVRGSVGRHAGQGMTGGRLEIEGDAGDWLACEMAGGQVRVGGRAGDNVAGALPGSEAGLQGGLVLVAGDTGDLTGSRMRRGLVAVGGSCGAAAGFEMRAGLVVVGGRVGRQPGLGMRRGSLLILGERPEIPASFRCGTAWNPPFVPLLFRRLARAGFQPAIPLPPRWRQWHGDLLAGGRGEILHPQRG